jgi:peptidoglycan hydrolase CwlO-like protein
VTNEPALGRGARRIAIGLAAFVLLAGGNTLAAADTKQQLEEAKSRLSVLTKQLTAQQSHLRQLQGELDRLAARINDAESRLAETQGRIDTARDQIRIAQGEYRRLRGQLARRARIVYEQGPASMLTVVLDSSSLADLSDRITYVSSVAQGDIDLANSVQNHAKELSFRRRDLERLEVKQAAVVNDLDAQQRKLAATFDQQQAVATRISANQREVTGLIKELQNRLDAEALARARAAARAPTSTSVGLGAGGGSVSGHPFQVCPVATPRSYVDSFGAPRVGHVHAGNDIMAPLGTPIYAPFSGRASSSNSGLGGLSVYVYGSQGFVFNAHLSRLGSLGSVSAGTVVGYVGSSGNASGGATHDHFEWHPSSIPSNPYRSPYGYTVISGAIDPYPYLNQVC